MIDYLNKRVKTNSEKKFIEYKNQSISFNQFNNIVNNLNLGTKNSSNKYIGLQINNKLKLVSVIIALNRQNKIPVIYPDYPNIKDYISTTNIKITFKDKDITLNMEKGINNSLINYNLNSTQIVIFTSGTTGQPKACELTYNNIYQSAVKWNKILNFNHRDIYLNHMPLTHVSGLCIFFRALYYNFTMILTDFKPKSYFNYIVKNNITLVSMVPSMLQKITNNTSQIDYNNNLKAIIFGGSKMNANTFNIIDKYKIPAYISYGMSETTSGIAGFWYHKEKPKHYKSHYNVNIELYQSQIIISSETIMKGYLHDKSLNNKFISNDLGEIYSNKSFIIKKRDNTVSNYGGESLSLDYINKHIENYSIVKQCELKIVKDNLWGEVLHAYVKLNKNIDEDILLKQIKKGLPKHMVPKKIIKQ